jgi:hypothetical protein
MPSITPAQPEHAPYIAAVAEAFRARLPHFAAVAAAGTGVLTVVGILVGAI